ncbi:hypothetical protein MT418_000344 [Batrachochytrium dendrobatidis]
MGISIAVLSETESTVSPPDVRSQSRLSIGRQSIVSEKNDMTAFSRNDFQPSPAPWSEYDINDDGMRARPRSGKRHNKLFLKISKQKIMRELIGSHIEKLGRPDPIDMAFKLHCVSRS